MPTSPLITVISLAFLLASLGPTFPLLLSHFHFLSAFAKCNIYILHIPWPIILCVSYRFTIYKVHKASKKKREKSSAKKERKATKTLAIVLGKFNSRP